MSDLPTRPSAPQRRAAPRRDNNVWPVVALLVAAVVLGVALPFIFPKLADSLMPSNSARNTQPPATEVAGTPTPEAATPTPGGDDNTNQPIIPVTTPTPEVATATPAEVRWVKADNVNMRKTAGGTGEANVEAKLGRNTMVNITGSETVGEYTWYKVEVTSGANTGKVGFIRGDFLSTTQVS